MRKKVQNNAKKKGNGGIWGKDMESHGRGETAGMSTGFQNRNQLGTSLFYQEVPSLCNVPDTA